MTGRERILDESSATKRGIWDYRIFRAVVALAATLLLISAIVGYIAVGVILDGWARYVWLFGWLLIGFSWAISAPQGDDPF